MNILTEEQLEVFLAATDRDPIWRDFFYTELTTGLRLGEICGLMWSDFDGQKGTLSISRTLRKEKGGRLVAGDTKTYAGTRTILLPTSTAERLRLRKINDHLWEGRYSPIVNGKRMARNVYAKTEAECEEKLAELIREMKAEIVDGEKQAKQESAAG